MFLCRFYHFLEALTCRINALHNPLIIIIRSVLPALLFTLFAFEVVFRGHGWPFFRFPELCSWHNTLGTAKKWGNIVVVHPSAVAR